MGKLSERLKSNGLCDNSIEYTFSEAVDDILSAYRAERNVDIQILEQLIDKCEKYARKCKDPKFGKDEVAAVRLYFSKTVFSNDETFSSILEYKLATFQSVGYNIDPYLKFIWLLLHAVGKFPKVYSETPLFSRCIMHSVDTQVKYKCGNEVIWPEIASCTTAEIEHDSSLSTYFSISMDEKLLSEIRDVTSIADEETNGAILFPPSSKFQIKKINKTTRTFELVFLGSVDSTTVFHSPKEKVKFV